MFILLNILCVVLVFFIGADVFSLADEIAYCKKNDIDILKRKYSTCRECGHRLRLKDTFPVVSRFINKGKCRFCDEPFSKRGFYTEVFGGLFAVVLYVVLYYICKLMIFVSAAVTIAAVIIVMLIVAWIYAPHVKTDDEETEDNKTKEAEEEITKQKKDKEQKKRKEKKEKKEIKKESDDDIALIDFDFNNIKNKEE